jgi:hypothetical protein
VSFNDTFNVRFWFIADFLIGCTIASFWAAILFWLPSVLGLSSPAAPGTMLHALTAGLVLLGGALAFAVRLWLRRVYGMVEVVFALIVTWKTVSDIADLSTLESSLALGAAMYLVVRGLDNWMQGVEARGRTPQVS